MTLYVAELSTTSVYQSIRSTRNQALYAIRAHLLVYGTPAGSLYLQLQDASGQKIKNSETISIATISGGLNYHGYIRFLISHSMKEDTIYRIALFGSGYSYGASNYVGWCMDWEFQSYDRETVGDGFKLGSLDYQMWTRKSPVRGEA